MNCLKLIIFFILFCLSACSKKTVNTEGVVVFKKQGVSVLEKNPSLLFYKAYQKQSDQKIDSIASLVFYYEKTLYGNLFWNNYIKNKISVTMEEIRQYYLKNRFYFKRNNEELLVLHYLTKDKEEAEKVASSLFQKDGNVRFETINKYNITHSKIKKGELPSNVDNIVFSSLVKKSFGPIKSKLGYHIVEISDRFKKNSYIGLDEVYDEISQTLYNNKKSFLFNNLVDSLFLEYKND